MSHPHTPAVLAEIIAHKRAEVAVAMARTPLEAMRERAEAAPQPRNFFAAVTRHPHPPTLTPTSPTSPTSLTNPHHTAIIAEIKRMSPSAGLIRPEYAGEGFSPESIAQAYHAAGGGGGGGGRGASAISCLTDEKFFGGHLSFIQRVKDTVPLPVLRKDFIIDPWQLFETRAAGADAVLLIAECLTESMLVDMLILAQQLHLTTLLEVHDMENLLRVRPYIGFPHASYMLLGINNRDLTTMRVDLSHTLRLADLVEDRTTLVSESGITTPQDLARLRAVGVRIALVGEHLMRQPDPGAALRSLIGPVGSGGGGGDGGTVLDRIIRELKS